MAIGRSELVNLIEEGKISITSTTNKENFNAIQQISNESIDLSLSNYGYKLKDDISFINSLNPNGYEDYFYKVEIPMQGYVLYPDEFILTCTDERITLPYKYYGLVFGRSTFSRIGLSIHFNQNKYSQGNNSVFPLQIKNNSFTPIVIFPYQKIAQLLIYPIDNIGIYEGQFSNEEDLRIPKITEKEFVRYTTSERKTIEHVSYNYVKNFYLQSKRTYIKKQSYPFMTYYLPSLIQWISILYFGMLIEKFINNEINFASISANEIVFSITNLLILIFIFFYKKRDREDKDAKL